MVLDYFSGCTVVGLNLLCLIVVVACYFVCLLVWLYKLVVVVVLVAFVCLLDGFALCGLVLYCLGICFNFGI